MDRYIGTKEASALWGVSQGTICKWCREKKIPGAEQDAKGSPWRIPADARCPNEKTESRKNNVEQYNK